MNMEIWLLTITYTQRTHAPIYHMHIAEGQTTLCVCAFHRHATECTEKNRSFWRLWRAVALWWRARMIAADNITATLLLFSLFFLERIQQQQQNNTILSSVRIRTQMSLFLSPFRFCFIFVMLRFCLSCILYALHLTWAFLDYRRQEQLVRHPGCVQWGGAEECAAAARSGRQRAVHRRLPPTQGGVHGEAARARLYAHLYKICVCVYVITVMW